MESVQNNNGVNTLPREQRFTRAEYRRLFDEGKSFPSRSFVMWVLRKDQNSESGSSENISGNLSFPKLGIVVSKKTFRHAVDRNRAKRLMRETFRLSKTNLIPNAMILLLGRRKIASDGIKLDDVMRDFSAACRKAEIWKQDEK